MADTREQPGDYFVRVNSARGEIGRYVLDCSLRVLDPSARGGLLERVMLRPINPGDPPWDYYLHGEIDRWIFVADAGLQALAVRGMGISARLLTAQGRPANVAPIELVRLTLNGFPLAPIEIPPRR